MRIHRSMSFTAKLATMTAVSLMLSVAALAAPDADATPPVDTSVKRPVCLKTIDIQNTHAISDRAIVFHMRDGTYWRNDLPSRCVGLYLQDGFAYEPTTPTSNDVCDNLVTIKVLEHGNYCMLGAFNPISRSEAQKVGM